MKKASQEYRALMGLMFLIFIFVGTIFWIAYFAQGVTRVMYGGIFFYGLAILINIYFWSLR